jgi:2,3-bisphosphoglycerate-independent phosphoglycerate mutase
LDCGRVWVRCDAGQSNDKKAGAMARPVVLCILDGWGDRPEREANAVALARTPNFDRIRAAEPAATLAAHGPDVGLPEGQMGNSEVGHTNIGAGRVVWMDLPRIDRAIKDGSFAANPRLAGFAAALKASGGTAHLAGLASPGGVHAHQGHIAASATALGAAGVPVVVHAFLDGRDVPPKSAEAQVAALVAALPDGARIATVSGRFYAMDRDRRWDRVEKAAAAIVDGAGARAATAAEAVAAGYARGETDEFVTPTVIGDYAGARDGDGLFFQNFRADRAREILGALVDPDFDGFAVPRRPAWAALLGMVEYSDRLNTLMPAVFPAEPIANPLGAWVAARGLRQFRLAETEKYPHVTFFLSGGAEAPAAGEDRHMAPSPKVRTYDLAPEMAAGEVTERLVAAIRSGDYDLIVVNYANPDMVGHTGDLGAAIRAVEAVDVGLGAALDALADVGGAMIVTADHGNAEMMVDPETGEPHTAHTLNPVPVILVGGPPGTRLRAGGRLADLAPSLLELLGVPAPPEMTGRSLIERT